MARSAADRGRLSPFQRFYVLAVAAIVIGPFLPLVVQSLAFRWAWPDLLPSVWWWEARTDRLLPIGWDYVLSVHSRVLPALVNTVAIGLAVMVLALAICLPAARVLARERFPGKAAVELFLAMPLLLPEAAIGLALLAVFIRLGLAGGYVGIVVAHLIPTVPYMIRMLAGVYQGLGPAFEEQARLLGASRRQVLLMVTIPMLMPGVVAGCLFTFLVSTNIFLLTFLMGQGAVETLPTLLFAKIGGGTLDASAAGLVLVASLPGILLLVLAERLIREDAFGKGLGG